MPDLNTIQSEELLSPAEAARRLSMTPTGVFYAIKNSLLFSYQIGKRFFIPISALAEYRRTCPKPGKKPKTAHSSQK